MCPYKHSDINSHVWYDADVNIRALPIAPSDQLGVFLTCDQTTLCQNPEVYRKRDIRANAISYAVNAAVEQTLLQLIDGIRQDVS